MVDRDGGGELRRLVVDYEQRGVLRREQVVADLVACGTVGHHGCTHEPWPRSRRIDCITWNVVLSVKTAAAVSTPVYFSTTGAAAVREILSR